MVLSRVALSVLLVALAGLSGTPAVSAKALVVSAPDPVRDMMVSNEMLLVPVDSIDIVGYSFTTTAKGFEAASIQVSDMTRIGLEDRLFVHGAHTVRMFGVTTVYEDYRALQLFLAVVDDEATPRAIAFFATPEGGTVLPVEASLDRASGRVAWELETPVGGPVSTRFVTSAMYGCDDFDDCNPVMSPVARALDMAPNELAGADAVVIPGTWWDDLFPEDDGSVPRVPVTQDGLAAAVGTETGSSWT